MNIITTIFNILIISFIGIVSISIFVQSFKDLWDEIGKEETHNLIIKIRKGIVKVLDEIITASGKARNKILKEI